MAKNSTRCVHILLYVHYLASAFLTILDLPLPHNFMFSVLVHVNAWCHFIKFYSQVCRAFLCKDGPQFTIYSLVSDLTLKLYTL